MGSEGSLHSGSLSFGKVEGSLSWRCGEPGRATLSRPGCPHPGGPVGSRAREKLLPPHSALKQLFPLSRKPPQTPHSSRNPQPAPHIRAGLRGSVSPCPRPRAPPGRVCAHGTVPLFVPAPAPGTARDQVPGGASSSKDKRTNGQEPSA